MVDIKGMNIYLFNDIISNKKEECKLYTEVVMYNKKWKINNFL